MIIDIINKILITIYVLSCLNLFRHGYYFIQAWIRSKEDNPEKYKLNTRQLLILGISISYIIMSIFDGITF